MKWKLGLHRGLYIYMIWVLGNRTLGFGGLGGRVRGLWEGEGREGDACSHIGTCRAVAQ